MIFLLWLCTALVQPRNPYCDVFGVMVEVDRVSQADFIVYEEESENFSDIIVFDQDNRLFANRPGHWHFVRDEKFARYRLFFTTDRDQADFSVFFTDFESFAGCNP